MNIHHDWIENMYISTLHVYYLGFFNVNKMIAIVESWICKLACAKIKWSLIFLIASGTTVFDLYIT